MIRVISILGVLLIVSMASNAYSQDTDEDQINELEQAVAEAKTKVEKTKAAYRDAKTEYQEALLVLAEARGGDDNRHSKAEEARTTMDRQIARSAGIYADLYTNEADNNMFGTGGLGVGASSFTGGVIGSSYSGHGGRMIMGALDKSVIDRAVKYHLDQIHGCYRTQLQHDPELQGQLVVRFGISIDGGVSSASVEESSLDNQVMEQCVCNRFRQMEFPSPRGGPMVTSYSLNFE